jgi:thiol-disulfide isomerase/thioredoxin
MTIVTLLFALIATPSAEGNGEPILLDFQAAWCGPCRQMRPEIEQLIQKGYPVKEIDLDRSPDLAARYQVTEVPTFIVVDPSGRSLARTKGLQPAGDLARMYLGAKARFHENPEGHSPETEKAPPDAAEHADSTEEDDEPAASRPYTNPKPWQSIVRIKVYAHGSIGFGSGTIIHSSPQESIILTCAHIFKMEHGPQYPPSRFPLRITVDLFDGNLNGQTVHYVSGDTYEGKAIDYDFTRDVGLIRIRPGRRVSYSRVVPPHWTPKQRMAMLTVGCSEGRDATVWNTTILNPSFRSLAGNATYEALECMVAPKQGRSGGGLFTSDGYVAGVCDFAEPTNNHGLYAAPRSIYAMLDRNKLAALYAPVANRPQTLLAGNRTESKPSANGRKLARAQSPDGDEGSALTIPPPELLGIKAPVVAEGKAASVPSLPAQRSGGWVARPGPSSTERAEMTDLKIAPAADSDRFASIPDAPEPAADPPSTAREKSSPSSTKWRPVRSPLPALVTDRP